MKNTPSYKAASLNAAKLTVVSLDSDLNEAVKDYKLVLDFNALEKAREQIGRDLTDLQSWKDITPADMYVVCWAALDRFHPEVGLKDLKQMVPWNHILQTWPLLIELCFPGITELIEKHKEKAQEGEPAPDPTGGANP